MKLGQRIASRKGILTVFVLITVFLAIITIPSVRDWIVTLESPDISLQEVIVDKGCPCEFGTNAIYGLLCNLSGKNLDYNEAQDYIASLHMSMFGVTNQNYEEVIETYSNQLSNLQEYGQYPIYVKGLNAILATWLDGLNIKAVAAGSGTYVTSTYGYDTIVLTLYGDVITCNNFRVWLM